jgi:hypothetical protein
LRVEKQFIQEAIELVSIAAIRNVGLVCVLIWLMNGLTLAVPEQDEPASKVEELKKSRIIFSPIVYYTPETRFAYGAAGSYIFRLSKDRPNDRPSSLSPIAVYTQEKQFYAQLKTMLYLKNEKYQIELDLKVQDYPDKFFGVGNDNTLEDKESYTSQSAKALFTFLRKIKEGLHLGIQYDYSRWDITEFKAGGMLADGTIPGSREGTVSGIGVMLNLDSRDNIFAPTRGEWIEFSARFYNEILGSSFNYSDFKLNVRKYIPVFKSHIIAAQVIVQNQGGNVPFVNMAKIGGAYLMRGYYDGRFRDKRMAVAQLEYRLPLFWRLGVVAFAGIGNVADKWSNFDLPGMKRSLGFGFRYLFDRKEKIYVRMDFGFGVDDNGFYLSIFEAF